MVTQKAQQFIRLSSMKIIPAKDISVSLAWEDQRWLIVFPVEAFLFTLPSLVNITNVSAVSHYSPASNINE